MELWADLVGQHDAVAQLRGAVQATIRTTAVQDQDQDQDQGLDTDRAAGRDASMTHAWLFTGPPGSGRANLAYAFAAALIAGRVDGDPTTNAHVAARTHPDLEVLDTAGIIIKIDDVREVVRRSHYSPSIGRYRVVVVEHADRMTDHTSNVLLKELEEPADRTVWVLCAPSDVDLLPTIRSRVRVVRLRVPHVDDVAGLVVARTGVSPAIAERAAREAQCHIGMALRLASNAEVRARRDESVRLALRVRTSSDAVAAAARLVELAGEDAEALAEVTQDEARERHRHSLGIDGDAAVPTALRSQLRALEEDEKRRASRGLRDGLDRILVDLAALFRDVLLVQLGAQTDLIHRESADAIAALAQDTTAACTLGTLDAIAAARTALAGNVPPQLTLEAMLATRVAADRAASRGIS